ncbi:MAG: LPXTG cell wall anchor domain-containing protein [Oscillospiraceae bacterium]|nr:LPXTG cell wall anchor domain-containing protein [Oscillospiraceae bacterium]
MKKKLTALLCTLCMAVTLCATAFAKAATPTMTATATLSEDKKQVKVVLSLSGMDGNYTGMGSDLVYDQSQITYNSHENGDVFDVLHINNARTRMIWEMSDGSVNKNGTAATLVFDVKDGVTGEIKIDVSSYITAYKEEGSLDPEDIDMAATSASVTIVAPQPTTAPTAEPTAAPTAEPTAAPTAEPTAAPTAEPTAAPTAEPTTAPTAEPTNNPTTAPTQKPSSDKSDKNDKKPDSTAAAATAVPAAQTPASPKTGDTANLALYGVLGVACVVALGVVIYRRKKANH